MKAIATLLLSTIMVGANAQKVTTDMDQSYDFSTIKTWMWIGMKEGSAELNDLDRKRMGNAFLAEFKDRKMVYQKEDADVAVSLFLVVSRETSTTAYTNGYGGTGYRYGRGGRGWSGGHATTTYSESDYLKGTLVVDFYDVKSQELIWQGVASGSVTEKPEKREKSIPKAVSKLMKKFPIEKVK